MSLSIEFRRAARAEFDRASDWYEQQRPGLGDKFTTAVRRVLARAAGQPDFYPPIQDDTREGLVQGFPYCVYYREEPGRIMVLAVVHNARDLKVWQRRV